MLPILFADPTIDFNTMIIIALAELEIMVNPDTYTDFYRTLEARSLLESYIRRVMDHLSENLTQHIIEDPSYRENFSEEEKEDMFVSAK